MSIDDRIRQLSGTILEEVRSPIEAALQTVLAEVMKLAAEDRDEAVRVAVAAAEERHQEQAARLTAAEAQHQEEAARLAAAEEQHQEQAARLTAAEAQHQEQAARFAAAEAEHQERAARLTAAEAQHQEQAARLAAAEERHQELTTRLTAADERHQEQAARLATVEAEHQEQAASLAAAEAAHEEHAARLSAAVAFAEQEQHRAEVERALVQQALQQVRAEALEAREAAAATERTLNAVHAADREHELACTDRMLTAFRQLDAAASLTEVLNALADHAAAETGRAAVLVVAGSRLRGWVLRGLGFTDPAAIDVPIEPYTVFGLALAQGNAVSTAEAPIGADGDPLSTLLAAPPGSAGLAIPISVGGRAVAILYADDANGADPMVPSTWPELVEILARHAGRCLEVLTMSRGKASGGGRAAAARRDAGPSAARGVAALRRAD